MAPQSIQNKDPMALAATRKSPKIPGLSNAKPNTNLGLPAFLAPDSTFFDKILLPTCAVMSKAFELTLEAPVFYLWGSVPLVARQTLSQAGWHPFLFIHKLLIGTRLALHHGVSEEYAALSTVMYMARLFPMTLGRMRFALNQIEVNFPYGELERAFLPPTSFEATNPPLPFLSSLSHKTVLSTSRTSRQPTRGRTTPYTLNPKIHGTTNQASTGSTSNPKSRRLKEASLTAAIVAS
jgi:hypothetical protein